MEFYTKLEDLYSQMDVLHAAQNSAYVTLDSLYRSLYQLEDTPQNFKEREGIQERIDYSEGQAEALQKKIDELDAEVQKLDGAR